ncbi:MAG TPA: IS1595 family transposase, partial [Rhodospirillales bacterium]
MGKTLSVRDFFKRFPDDDTCLGYLMRSRYGEKLDCPKCGKHGKFHRIKRHPAFECAWCGFEIFPMVGTPFHRSHTSLQKWFYAIYLFCNTRHGVSAKELQRQLSVTYKTAWRMGHEIRQFMADVDGEPPLTGHVEVDETYIGGRTHGQGRGTGGKTVVFGILERNGEVFTKVVPNAKRKTLVPEIVKNVPKGTRISSDGLRAYKGLSRHGYTHESVNHDVEEWARGNVHVNSLEGFWSMLKRSIRGTHVHVSRKHLPK